MNIIAAALDLVLPQPCAGCDTPGGLLCRACESQLFSPARLCLPSPTPAGLPPPWTVAPYAGPVRQLIVAHKERGLTGLARPLGSALARAVLAAAESVNMGFPILVVPVPSSRASTRRRGHDPTLRITREAVREAARVLGPRPDGRPPVSCVRALKHRRKVADQAGLTAADRLANLENALQAHVNLTGHRVIVVDDVVTSGATLTEAARALREAGAEVPTAAAIAATERHSGGPFTATTHNEATTHKEKEDPTRNY